MSDENKLSRRGFIKDAAIGAAAVAGAGLLSATPALAQTQAGGAFPVKYTTDVVVVGAGGGGEAAAVSAAQEGLKVILIEVSQKTGGGLVYSGGIIHCAGLKTWEEYLAYTEGLHDPDLGKTYVETFRNTYIPWLTKINAYFTPGTGTGPLWSGDPKVGKGEPGNAGHRKFMESLEAAFKGFGGGPLLLKTRAMKLLTDDKGVLTGVRVSTWSKTPTEPNQEVYDIKAKAVILACGNFMNNPELKQRYLGPYGDKAMIMGVPYARGDGMRMAQEVGASLSGGMSTYSGIPIALTPINNQTESDPDKFEAASAASNPDGTDYGGKVGAGKFYGPGWIANTGPALGPSYGIMVNLNGKRFVDENSTMDAKYPRGTEIILQQRQGMALVIGDKTIYDAVPGSKMMLDALSAPGTGATVVTANTLQELADGIAKKFPFYSASFLKTIADYNAAIDAKKTDQLEVPRTVVPAASEKNGGLYKIATAPFYAFAVTACIYNNMGGVAVNTSAQVLDMQKKPIPGLYATFPCAGGLMNTIYTGGNAAAQVFGYIAGKSVAKALKV